MFQIGLKKFLLLKKLKILCHGNMLLVILKMKKLLELFMKNSCKRANQKEFRLEKVKNRKGNELYAKRKGYNGSFNSWIDKKNIWMSEYFPKSLSLGANVKVELDLSNYVTKSDLKNATGADTSKFAEKVD